MMSLVRYDNNNSDFDVVPMDEERESYGFTNFLSDIMGKSESRKRPSEIDIGYAPKPRWDPKFNTQQDLYEEMLANDARDAHFSLPEIEEQQMSANPYVQKYLDRRAAGPLIKSAKLQARAQALRERAAEISAVGYKPTSYKRKYKRRYKRRYRGRRYYGRGDYYPSAGTNMYGKMGGYLGALAGETIGHYGSRILGVGDYEVRKNVLSGRLPEVTNIAGNGGTVIRFQEYICDIITGDANTFSNQSFLLNAANQNTFPWLSQVAANYDQYELQGILFEYRSTSSNALNSTNTALGTVMMATQYDVVDLPFSSKVQMLNYEFSTSCVPSSNQIHMIECDPHQTTLPLLYTDAGETNPPNTDPRLYFLGRFQIATTGFQAANINIGELHVTYQVKLLKPKLSNALGGDVGALFAHIASVSNANVFGSGTDGNTGFNNTGISATGGTITFPPSAIPKVWRISIQWDGIAHTVVLPGIVGSSGLTWLPNPYYGVQHVEDNTTCDTYMYEGCLSVPPNQLSSTLVFDGTGTLPTGASCTLRITECPLAIAS